MAAITLVSPEPTQITLSTTVTDTVTVPAVRGGAPGAGVIVSNVSGATTLRATAGAVGAALDPAGPTAVLIPTGQSRYVPVVGASSADAIDVKVVGSANVYYVRRDDIAVIAAPNLTTNAPALRSFATLDVASLIDGAGATSTVSCLGAALGDFALASHGVDVQGISVTAWVSAADTVSVRFQNESGGTLDLASTTIKVRVIR